jgi:integrase
MNSYEVKIFALWVRKDRPKPFTVRWEVAGRRQSRSFATQGLADSYRSQLMYAARSGEPFDVESGLPTSMSRTGARVTWFEHACRYVDMKWPKAAGKTRAGMADALATVTVALVRDDARPPDVLTVRKSLIGWAFNPKLRNTPRPANVASALAWVERASLPLSVLNDPKERPRTIRAALDACSLTLDGRAAAATTTRRKRAVLYNTLGYAVELGELVVNPVDTVQWRAPAVAETVDRRVVPSPAQVRDLLTAVTYVGRTVGPRLKAFFALLYFAALRPSEALDLRIQDCDLPEEGWGTITLVGTEPEVGRAWTDDGSRTQERGLKWRSTRSTRPVPIPPELVALLREHVSVHGTSGGRLFATATGGRVTSAAYYRTWRKAREYALPSQVAASPLAGRPYDLRHGGVTLWLNAGVPAPEVARRAGHSVDVLLKIYAGCVDGQEESVNERIGKALAA